MQISMKIFYQYMAIFFNFSTTVSHLHPLQVENCDSNSRLVVDKDDNGKLRFEKVNSIVAFMHHMRYIELYSLSKKCYDPSKSGGFEVLFN